MSVLTAVRSPSIEQASNWPAMGTPSSWRRCANASARAFAANQDPCRVEPMVRAVVEDPLHRGSEVVQTCGEGMLGRQPVPGCHDCAVKAPAEESSPPVFGCVVPHDVPAAVNPEHHRHPTGRVGASVDAHGLGRPRGRDVFKHEPIHRCLGQEKPGESAHHPHHDR